MGRGQEIRRVPQKLSISANANLLRLEKHNPNELVHMFVQGNESEVNELLVSYNGIYKFTHENWHSVAVKASKVRSFVSESAIQKIDLNFHKGQPMADTVLAHLNVTSLHNGDHNLPHPYTGKDVVMGYIDSGIDFNHADFKDSLGNSRVLFIWDQADNSGTNQPSYGYGREWTNAEIDAGTCTHTDPGAYYGHGTSVAALGSGNGLATGNYPGVATESEIVFVATNFNAANWTNTVADAIDYIFAKADALGKPCVINTSVGTYYGSHDGNDVAAQYISDLIEAEPGRSVVASAGNAGDIGPFHLKHTTTTSDTAFTWFKYNSNSSYLGYGAVFFELWADTADFNNIQFAVGADQVTPNFKFRGRTSFDNISNRISTLVSENIEVNGNVIGQVDTWAEIKGGQYFLQVHIMEPDSSDYYFRFITTGEGTSDIWSTQSSILSFSNMVNNNLPSSAEIEDIDNYVLPDEFQSIVSSWTCLPNVITVGNYMNRQGFTDVNGNYQSLGSTPVGERYPSSSIGPNRLGDVKPNVIAPGNKALTAAPLDQLAVMLTAQPNNLAPDSLHRTSPGGTSSASPVVAGVVALLMERCPGLSNAEIMDLLQSSARNDNQTGVTPNVYYGYGKADALEAFKKPLFDANLTVSGNVDTCSAFYLRTQSSYDVYQWNGANSEDSILVDTSDVYFATVKDANGCLNFTDTLILNYLEDGLGDFSIAYSDTVICIGDTAVLSVPSGYAYSWSNGKEESVVYATDGGKYYATIIDTITGCTGNTDSVQVSVDLYLLGDFEITKGEEVCEGDSVMLVLPSGYTSYIWSHGINNDTVYVKSDDDYHATVINSLGCGGFSDTVEVSFYVAPPIPSITQFGDSLLMSSLANSYQWYYEDSLLVNDTLQNMSPFAEGNYQVEVFLANGCSSFSDLAYYTLGSESVQLETNVKIFPNPSNGIINIEVNPVVQLNKIELYDIHGSLIYQQNKPTDNMPTIKIDGVPNGIYMIQIGTKNGILNKRVIVN